MEQFERQTQTVSFPGTEADFEQLFKSHFRALHRYAFTFVKDPDIAEDMVQSAFCKLWERSGDLQIHRSVSAYLYRSVYHECLNYLKHLKVRGSHVLHTSRQGDGHEGDASQRVQARELEDRITQTLQELPEGCRTVFQLSRFESLKYHEIASKLGISVKTVENQMGKALRVMRLKLAEYLPLIGVFLFCIPMLK